MQDLLGDLIPKGEKCGSKQGMDQSKACSQQRGRDVPKKKKFQRRKHVEWIMSTYARGVANRGRNKGGNHGFRGRSNRHWMMVSIQASVSGSI